MNWCDMLTCVNVLTYLTQYVTYWHIVSTYWHINTICWHNLLTQNDTIWCDILTYCVNVLTYLTQYVDLIWWHKPCHTNHVTQTMSHNPFHTNCVTQTMSICQIRWHIQHNTLTQYVDTKWHDFMWHVDILYQHTNILFVWLDTGGQEAILSILVTHQDTQTQAQACTTLYNLAIAPLARQKFSKVCSLL